MPKAVGRIQQEDRRQRATGQLFDEPAYGIKDESERIAPGYHLEKPFLSGKQHLGPLSVVDVGHRSIPLDDASHLVAQRHCAA